MVEFQHLYGTAEYEIEVSKHTGFPYGAELTYKHAYWWHDEYTKAWNDWLASGQVGLEPNPPEGPDYRKHK